MLKYCPFIIVNYATELSDHFLYSNGPPYIVTVPF